MRTRSGSIPKDSNGLIYQTTNDYDHPLWSLYRRAAGIAPWVSLKLTHLDAIAGAANYWLAWNTDQKRFNNSRDTARLLNTRPELYEQIQKIMRELYPTLTEEDMRIK